MANVWKGIEIPIADAINELVEMDFADYGGYATFLHIRDNFSRFSAIIFFYERKRKNKRRKWRKKV